MGRGVGGGGTGDLSHRSAGHAQTPHLPYFLPPAFLPPCPFFPPCQAKYVELETRKDGIKFTNRPLRQAAERLQQLSAEYDRRQADLVAQARAWAVCQRLPEPVISHTMDVDLSWGSPAPPARLGLPWCVSSTCGTPSCAPLTRAGGGRGCHLLRGVGLGVCRAG